MRPSKKDYYLGIAKAVAQRSTCLRAKYGAVIVKDDVIISTGYNGSPRGDDNCTDIGTCYRIELNVPQGQMYEKCVAVHAEQNALLSAGREALGATLYLYGEGRKIIEPCLICSRLIKNAGIEEVITNTPES